MAEIFPDEGLDHILAIFPSNGAGDATLYIGLFTSQTASTVPARTAQNVGPVGWTEATGTDYARQSIAAASWGSLATNGNGRRLTAAQVTFPTVGAGGWGTVNGFFIASTIDQSSGVIIYFANFDDGIAKALVAGAVEKVTPSIQFDG